MPRNNLFAVIIFIYSADRSIRVRTASLFFAADFAVVTVIGTDALSALGLQLAAVIAIRSVRIVVIVSIGFLTCRF